MTTVPPRPARPRGLRWPGRRASETGGLFHERPSGAVLGGHRPARGLSPAGVTVALGTVLVSLGTAWLGVRLERPLEPWLLGAWGGGALLLAYLLRVRGLLLAGIGALTAWWIARVVWDGPEPLTLVVVLGVAATTCLAVAAVHETRLPRFGAAWRETGAVLAVVMLFVALLPSSTAVGFTGDSWLVGGPVFASVAVVVALTASEGSVRLEPLVALTASVASVVLVIWDAGPAGSGPTTASHWVHTGASVAAYVALAAGVALLGIVRDSRRLTNLATVGITASTVVQGYAALAPVAADAWPLAGVVGAATGSLFHRTLRLISARPAAQR